MSDRGEFMSITKPQPAQAHHSTPLKLPDLLQRAPSGGERGKALSVAAGESS
jgi:hypothetical protein